MEKFIFAFAFFILGYIYAKYTNALSLKKVLLSAAKVIELSFYYVLKDFMEMHTLGLKALEMTLEKCSEDNPEKAEEYKKIKDVYSRKFEEFGNFYFKSMTNIFTHELKYKSYKEVKAAFNMLIIKENKESQDA